MLKKHTSNDYATKNDVATMVKTVTQDILFAINGFANNVQEQFQELRTELKDEIKGLRTELKGEIHYLKNDVGDIRSDISTIKSDIREIQNTMVTKDYLEKRLKSFPHLIKH